MKSPSLLALLVPMLLLSCGDASSTAAEGSATEASATDHLYPSDVLPFLDKWKILNGDGSRSDELIGYEAPGFFYAVRDSAQGSSGTPWVVYKTPNAGVTSRTSSNTRTELGEIRRWTPEEGGRLTGTLKVMHVSTSGDARVAASHSVVVGQMHSMDGHENEPLKIFYKKFPGHELGSVFWNYEINTAGEDNGGRWDYSTPVWGHDMFVLGETPDAAPAEPTDGVALGEEFSYAVDVREGLMTLTFERAGEAPKTFTKSLVQSEYTRPSDIPDQIRTYYAAIGRDGVERPEAYAGERQFFKQGAYNQTNGKSPEDNIVWSTGAETYDGDIERQYANGDYAEVWFREGSLVSY